MSSEVGYVSLIVMLVVVPTTAVLAAVIDRMVVQRRDQAMRRTSNTRGAFPVIPLPTSRVEDDSPVQSPASEPPAQDVKK